MRIKIWDYLAVSEVLQLSQFCKITAKSCNFARNVMISIYRRGEHYAWIFTVYCSVCVCVCVCVYAHAQLLSHVQLFATPWTVARQGSFVYGMF